MHRALSRLLGGLKRSSSQKDASGVSGNVMLSADILHEPTLGLDTSIAAGANQRPEYSAPLWLLQPPASSDIPWKWEVPSLVKPVSQLCTGEQLEDAAFLDMCSTLQLVPAKHRKLWEFAYIVAALDYYGKLKPGSRLLGFGVGTEPLPGHFASRGAFVTASDAPIDITIDGWHTTNQHSTSVEQLFNPNIVSRHVFDRNVEFRPIDMNNIPADAVGYDGCWSSCALEHLGGIDAGLNFIENSLNTLNVGGLAVHTTEFNLSSNTDTLSAKTICLFRRRDMERLIVRLTKAGHEVMPLNLYPGSPPEDGFVDVPPYGLPHLKLQVASYVSTSFGIIVRKGTGGSPSRT